MIFEARLFVMSHLSDVQELSSYTIPGPGPGEEERIDEIQQRINFAKYIIIRTKGDLTQEINPDEWWVDFLKDEE